MSQMTRAAAPLIAVLVIVTGCNDRTTPPDPISTTGPDAGVTLADISFDDPVRGLCVPGSRRCVAENSPMFEECGRLGALYEPGSCEAGDVCRDGECVPFSCVPGRPLCVGANTSAVCDATGRAVEERVACEGANVCLGGACIDPCEQARDSASYIACDYVASELPNLYRQIGTQVDAPFAVVVANPARLHTSEVSVAVNGREAQLVSPFVLKPARGYALGEATTLQSELLLADGTSRPIETTDAVVVPAGAAGVFLLNDAGPFRVQSTRPIVAYQFSPYCCNFTATNDASLLLPTSTWGTRYRVLGYPAWPVEGDDFLQAYVSISSTVDTTVTVQSPVELRRTGEFETFKEAEIEVGASESVVLETVADADSDPRAADLSGTVIEGEESFAVFTGHPCTFVPQDQWACDHLEEAILPSTVLGTRYVLTPARRRADPAHEFDPNRDIREATYWRLLADERAEIELSPPLDQLDVLAPSNEATPDCRDLVDDDKLVLDAGELCEFGTTTPTTVESTGALIVGGVISGHQSTGVSSFGTQAGDPSLFVLPPVEQFRADYAFVTPPTFKRGYVTIAARPSTPVVLDGRAVDADQRLERSVVELDGSRWEVFTIAVESGVHSLTSENGFGIVVYAYDDYVSYAFTGGLDLLPKGARR